MIVPISSHVFLDYSDIIFVIIVFIFGLGFHFVEETGIQFIFSLLFLLFSIFLPLLLKLVHQFSWYEHHF